MKHGESVGAWAGGVLALYRRIAARLQEKKHAVTTGLLVRDLARAEHLEVGDQLADGTPLIPVVCRCHIWPITAPARLGRCADCGVRPKPIPKWEDLP